MPLDTPELMFYRLAELEKQQAETAKEFHEFKKEIDIERTKYFVWGIGALGAAVLGMGSYIFSLFGMHPK